MLKIESKIGQIPQKDEKIYNFLSDFNHFNHFIPADKVKNWEATTDTCKFKLEGLGDIGFKIVEKEPFKLIKVAAFDSKFDFTLWIQLKAIAEDDTRIKISLDAALNPFIQAFAKKPLQDFLNMLVDRMETFTF
jgi:carbon monoxide dehydrogenase subunit G